MTLSLLVLEKLGIGQLMDRDDGVKCHYSRHKAGRLLWGTISGCIKAALCMIISELKEAGVCEYGMGDWTVSGIRKLNWVMFVVWVIYRSVYGRGNNVISCLMAMVLSLRPAL